MMCWEQLLKKRDYNLYNPVTSVNQLFVLIVIRYWNRFFFLFSPAYWNDLNSKMNPSLLSHDASVLVAPHSDPSVFPHGFCSASSTGAQEKVVPTRRGERWREPSPHHCPHTLQARIACKITFSRGGGGWRGIHCFGMGQWVCVIKRPCSYKCPRLLDQVSP